MNNRTNLAEKLDVPEHLHFYTDIIADVETPQNPRRGYNFTLDDIGKVIRLRSNATAANVRNTILSDENEQVWFKLTRSPEDQLDDTLRESPYNQVFQAVKNDPRFALTYINTIDADFISNAEIPDAPEYYHSYLDLLSDVETSQLPLMEHSIELDKARAIYQEQNTSTASYFRNTIPRDENKLIWSKLISDSEDQIDNALHEFRDTQVIWAANNTLESAFTNKSEIDVDIISNVIQEQLERIFTTAQDEQFEIGIESQFSKGLQKLCGLDPSTGLQLLKTRFINSDADSEVLAEVLRWASHQRATEIRNLIVDLLLTGLHNVSSLVRDTAALSLAYLEEAGAIVQLQQALEREKVPELKRDLEDLIRLLEN